MTNRCLTILLTALALSTCGCSTTTHQVGPSYAAMNHRGIDHGDKILVRIANHDDANSSSGSEVIRITAVTEAGISGSNENGQMVFIDYDEIFEIEYTKARPIKPDSEAFEIVGKATNVAGEALFVVACLAVAGNGVACPSID